ncbi:DNA photolyase family protein [Alsobacter sp. SYSU M60028]|uniref:DNA photolyase family protein n=1 Tax=Alsobacter ponti TaxID=2962936 RepID=A0ABT1LAP4_9HYPH|nr:deoxyribodipyrimidine photo-lyase [Alsobacter ponti]MCP8938547.1 DNA photolyase family protein [Alsobacter ponti]
MTTASTSPRPVIVWFRDDLRLSDNPALTDAMRRGAPVLAAYVFDEESPDVRPPGGASRWWLHHSLSALERGLAARGGRLAIFRGAGAETIVGLAKAADAACVVWNRRYGAAERQVDSAAKAALRSAGREAESFNAALLREPWEVKSRAGAPMKVFTPFWKAAQALGEPAAPTPAPARMPGLDGRWPGEIPLAALDLLPTRPDWAGGLRATWKPGEDGARERLSAFLDEDLRGYAARRDRPDLPGTSRLSPHLRFGEISPRQVWHAAHAAALSAERPPSSTDLTKFLAELGWREFSYHLLFHNPDLATRNYQPRFDAMPWRDDAAALEAWRRGRTGYPFVDAGMRQLWETGWMHNRTRMVAASFLIKHLLIDWRVGEAWFWDTLVDADPASNAASWQWVAGSGADAAPYYRIFNPVLQGEKLDPAGDYVRRFVPELADLPPDAIHRPWSAGPGLLAGIASKRGYPGPIVDHDAARARALAALAATREPDA